MTAQPAWCLRPHQTGRRLVKVDTHTHARRPVSTLGASCGTKVAVSRALAL